MKHTFLAILFLFVFLNSCSDKVSFEQTETGLEYAFVEVNDTNQTPNVGDGLIIDMKFYWNDSLLFDTREIALDYRITLRDPQKKGVIYQGMSMMHIGDSAIFKIDALNFYNFSADLPSPACIRKGDKLTFHVRLIDIMTPEEMETEKERIRRMKIKNEQELLMDYLKLNDFCTTSTECGIYYKETKRGYGKSPEIGDSVTLHYEGFLINNEPFDSSIKRGKPFSFVFGDQSLITGWTKGVGLMKEGGKATIVIPSELAYGDKGAGDVIPPYSTVVFNISLINVKKN